MTLVPDLKLEPPQMNVSLKPKEAMAAQSVSEKYTRPEELPLFSQQYNGSDDLQSLRRIVTHPCCEAGTAQQKRQISKRLLICLKHTPYLHN